MKPAVILFLSLWCLSLFGDEIQGFWKSFNQKTGHPGIIVAIYPYEGKYYGRILGSYDNQGVLDDTIYLPQGRAVGIKGDPFYSGLDFIWNVSKKGSKYRGKIIDPRKGKTYDVELRREGDQLIVRGELLFFGRSQTWSAATESDFSPAFKKPDMKTFVPVIPQGK